MYRFSFRACLYMQGPYSSSSCPYHLSQSLHWRRTGSCAWRSFGSSYIPRDIVRLTERLGFKPAESAWLASAIQSGPQNACFGHPPANCTLSGDGPRHFVFVSERYRRLSAILTRKHDLTPDSDWGWLVGVIL